ncbi:tyrosine-protein kinase Fer-like isoform X1 [Mytilus californianus]|uniref:tyrosine-protein kinase Fer-like isoform X1 n=1 Tax=Mytilus californianus TaxID=6549 RepID=UPI002245A18B|nr:tyrosine-protein kinase Fer-like isoform X1 [Mytilus californianus]
MSSKGFEIKCRDDIIGIPDVPTGFRFVKSWGLISKGLRTKDQIIKVLLNEWDKKHTTSGEGKKPPNLDEVVVNNKETRELLLQKYVEVKSFYDKLNDILQKDINSVFQNFTEELEYRQRDILSQDCFILIAGDRVAGKSSFVNLILRKDLLPTQQLACTATICEIRHSRNNEKEAILYNKDEKGIRRLDLGEDEKNDFKKLKYHIQELNEDDESPFEKIEIFWPSEIIKNGIVLVDTPGIGENRLIIKRLQEYMKESFGFIYIIDSAQAAGLQRGRLSDFLRSVVNSSDDIFDSRATLFVCNKWDVVPPQEQREIKSLTLTKLKKIFPEVKDEQVFTISTLQAAKSVSFGSIAPDFQFLFENGIKSLIPASIKNKLLSHYRWLKMVLQRICFSLKVTQSMEAQDVKVNKDTISKLRDQLKTLKNDAEEVLESAKHIAEKQIDLLHKEMADLLRSRAARDKICTWVAKDCPKQADYKKVAQDASEMIADRIMQVIDAWENEHHFVQGLQDTIIQKFEEECKLMDNQMQEVAVVLRISGDVQSSDIQNSITAKMLSKSKDRNISNSLGGLGSAVSCAGLLSTTDKRVKELLKKYRIDKAPENTMMHASVHFMESIFNGQRLRESLSKFLKRFIKGIDSVADKIPNFIKADHELLWEMELNLNDTKSDINKVYPALCKRANDLQGQLDLFYVTKCMKQDYSHDAIRWDTNDILGVGSFANVYKASIKVGQDNVNVALKITNDQNSVKDSTVTDILREENTLRSLKHENIIQFYGSVLLETETNGMKKLKWIMILEFCFDTLKNKLVGGQFKNPGRAPADMRNNQIKTMASYAVQLCAGLQYLHDKNLVHRDLKLENVLVTRKNEEDIVKLTDVGLTKSENFISGTFAGSLAYMAPEIILRTGVYDRKADIYSLAIILWEIWYGQDAAEHIGKILRDKNMNLEEGIKSDNLRPSLELETPPTLEIKDVIVTCWNDEPKKRLDARDVEHFFKTFL